MAVAAVYVRTKGERKWRLHSVAERLDDATMVAQTIQVQQRSRGVSTSVFPYDERSAVLPERDGV